MWPTWAEQVAGDVSVFLAVLRLAGDREFALEAIHEAVVRLETRVTAGQIGSYDHFRNAVRVTAERYLIDQHRRSRPGPLTDEGSLPSREDEGEDEERLEAVRQALGKLSEADRQVLRLHHFEDLGHQEVARRLNCATSTAWRRQREALARLRQVLLREDFELFAWLEAKRAEAEDGPSVT